MSSDGFAARAQAAAATNKASGQKPESGGNAEQGKSQGTALPRGDKKVASGGGWWCELAWVAEEVSAVDM